MGQVTVITKEQQLLLDQFKKDTSLTSNFYFTGGTALSSYYLQHRESVDLDFFSEEEFNPQTILAKMNVLAKNLKTSIDYVPIEDTYVFNFIFPNKQVVKVDFAFYPYQRLEKSQIINGIQVDSILDIAVNKLLTLHHRAEVKDFVDLYFLLERFTVWDLIEGVRVKFRANLDPFIIASEFMKVEKFDFLPKMIKPLTLDRLKEFFKQRAKDLADRSTI